MKMLCAFVLALFVGSFAYASDAPTTNTVHRRPARVCGVYFADKDSDGHGDPSEKVVVCDAGAARLGTNLVLIGDDVNDGDPRVWQFLLLYADCDRDRIVDNIVPSWVEVGDAKFVAFHFEGEEDVVLSPEYRDASGKTWLPSESATRNRAGDLVEDRDVQCVSEPTVAAQ